MATMGGGLLLCEGRLIQRRLRKDPPKKGRFFAKLVMEGQIHSALRYLTENYGSGVLSLTDELIEHLQNKRPNCLVQLRMSHSLYQQINGEMIREAALRTKGSGSPCGVDAVGFCKSFKSSSTNLCDALATLARVCCFRDHGACPGKLANPTR